MINELLSASKDKKSGKKNNEIYEGAYYTLGGVVTGFIIAELWSKLNLPGLDVKITTSVISNQNIDNANGLTMDKFIMTMASSVLALAGLFGLSGGAASGGGLLLGYTFATQSRKGKYLGQV